MSGWRARFERWLLSEWADGSAWQFLLRPLCWLFQLLVWLRQALRASGIWRPATVPVPVVVVGNLTVGGSGKTPCVIALAEALAARGWRPGIVSRGYGGRGRVEAVTLHSVASEVGDEPLLIARRTGCPVWVGRDRVAAARALCAESPEVNVLISDDGLQHWRLPRAVEVVVVDARRGFGNRRLLPAGPLREPLARLLSVTQLWVCGDGPVPERLPRGVETDTWRIGLTLASAARSLAEPARSRPLIEFAGLPLTAVAGIAAPERFFAMLEQSGVTPQPRPFPDHHPFVADDLADLRDATVLMTEKDGVKCQAFAAEDWWAAPLAAQLPTAAVDALEHTLRQPPKMT